MDIRVIGSNMAVGGALTTYVEEHLNRHIKKYFENAVYADVHFHKHNGKHGEHFDVNILINEGVKDGIIIKSDSSAGDAYGCFNEALQKAVEQLRKYKEKIKNHRRQEGGLKNIVINNN